MFSTIPGCAFGVRTGHQNKDGPFDFFSPKKSVMREGGREAKEGEREILYDWDWDNSLDSVAWPYSAL